MHENEFFMTDELWEQARKFHHQKMFTAGLNASTRKFHREQYKIISARLKKKNWQASTGRNSAKPAATKNEPMKNNSRCVECGKPAMAPKGNWNLKSVTLCKNRKCRRKRKIALQRERRKQKLLKLTEVKPAKRSKHDSMPTSRTAKAARKLAFYGGGDAGQFPTASTGA